MTRLRRCTLPSPSGLREVQLTATWESCILNHMVQFKGSGLDDTFAAVSDPTRRGILERLGRGDQSISQLATSFDMTLTGMKKHVGVLEKSRLVTTRKLGRVRTCRIGPRRLAEEAAWIERYQHMMEARFNRMEELLARTPEEIP